jgi:cation diffusion facilitator family transporter
MSVCTLNSHHDNACHNGVNQRGERNTWWVIVLTLITMAAEICAGMIFGSMALLADGWHMGTHAAALGITVLAYRLARRHTANPQFVFGTGKIGVLGGYTSAVVLALVALLMAAESIERLLHPRPIHFNESIMVAVLGLAVNLVSALILKDGHHPRTDHDHGPHDHNLKAAYLHVLADALTSILAIAALTAGKWLGWIWLDPVIGIVGAAVILKWSQGLLRDTSRILLDRNIDLGQVEALRKALAGDAGDRVTDLHVWQINPGQTAAVVRIDAEAPKTPEFYKQRLEEVAALDHVTVEVNRRCPDDAAVPDV